ncbi:pentapeptide repeat-containing protein [Streptosporangium sp. NPDC002721]|uniref:pentapeptide repeat-containing protein n=1 Tax=Streptosporangium sp. NPDC002721 TaxID=3366188 RepID=UPI003677BC41
MRPTPGSNDPSDGPPGDGLGRTHGFPTGTVFSQTRLSQTRLSQTRLSQTRLSQTRLSQTRLSRERARLPAAAGVPPGRTVVRAVATAP